MDQRSRLVKSLLKSALVASAVFAAAWFRTPLMVTMTVYYFIFYGILITILSIVFGFPLALIIERLKIGRWWSYLVVAMASGALLGSVLSSHPAGGVENPFAITFSPWTRVLPGFADNPPIRWKDYLGTIAFGAIVGGALGSSFWFFYSRSGKNQSDETRRSGRSPPAG